VNYTRYQALPGNAAPESLAALKNLEAKPQEMSSPVEPGNEKPTKKHLKKKCFNEHELSLSDQTFTSDAEECARRQMLLPWKQLNPIASRTKTTNQLSQHYQQYCEYPEQLR
jgi:hypothetical protein